MKRGKQGKARHAVRVSLNSADGAHGVTRLSLLSVFLLLLVLSRTSAQSQALSWRQLPPLPDAIGFAGAFAGVNGGALIVAGGANFPEAMPWAGGQKVWHNSILVLPKVGGEWRSGFKLPRPLAYGVSITTSQGVLCAGGSNAREHFRDAFLLSWTEGKIQTTPLPPLPRPMANGCGALLGRTVYLAGGTETPEATNALKIFWALDLSQATPRWKELEPWPGPARMLAVAAAQYSAFFLVSGVELSGDSNGKPVRSYLKDAYRFKLDDGWRKIAELPCPVAAAPSPAPTIGDSAFLILGGDDGSRVGSQPPEQHPGFPKTILSYDIATDSWKPLGEIPAAHVTTPTVKWNNVWVIPSGEVRPGVRSPEVWTVHAEGR